MFEGTKSIDWSCFKQAHGDASHVPDAIKALVSDDESTREKAYWKLDNFVVLQSDLYEAAFYVIPFLVEILLSKVFSGREHVYALLSEIANGYAPDSVTIQVDGNDMPLTLACRTLVLEHVDVYLDEVKDIQSGYRDSALDLLGSLNEKSGDIRAALENVLITEKDLEIKVLIKEVLEEFDG